MNIVEEKILLQITEQTAHFEHRELAEKITAEVIAPVMYGFVNYILKSAAEKGIKTLYFLARDGFLMQKIAERIKAAKGYSLNLRYLYCSRVSLRLAAISVMPREEAYSLLLMSGVSVTPKSLLDRLYLTKEQRDEIYGDMGFTADENALLSKAELGSLTERLKNSKAYNSALDKIGRERYPLCTEYLKNNIDLSEKFAIADTGWTGSVQHTLGQLLHSMGYEEKLTGYYFGLYNKQNPLDGNYFTYAFCKNKSVLGAAKFNNHLFEAICSAPHGMTVRYERINGEIAPVFDKKENLNGRNPFILAIQHGVTAYAENPMDFAESNKREDLDRMYKLMYKPPKAFAQLCGSLYFSDDISEERPFPMAERLDGKRLHSLILPVRMYRKLIHADSAARPVFWPYGSVALSDKGGFYRLNSLLWEILWLMKK
ncbi:MAG: hypothetical protein ACI4J1_06745 [Ruminiclostridium sp.]